jgi:single-stranded-DNA-specific exonuclease
MISVSGKYWEEIKFNKRIIDKIKIDHNLNDIQSKIVLTRNYSDEEIFLIKNNIEFRNPFLKTKDFLKGCQLLKENIKNKKNILIIGDYDVDGCMSTSMLVNFINNNHGKVDYYIPDRFKDGYGASKNLTNKLIKIFNPNLIIFLDCGSNSYDAIKHLKAKKIKTLIIDHHNTVLPYPDVDVFINPKKDKIDYNQYDYLCTTLLIYLFLDLYTKINNLNNQIKDEQIYALLATVADVMPMRGMNKILAKNVLNFYDITKNYVLRNFFKILNIKNYLTLYELGYKIAPLINAAGRLENANQIIKLFTSKSENQILSICKNIHNLNQKRKLIENQILDELDYEKFQNQNDVLFFYKPNLHLGVIGIIASRIKDYFNKPCVVLTNSNNVLKGSIRSTSNFNIGEYIQKAIKLNFLLNGGGHNLAAGITLKKTQLEGFKNFINDRYRQINKSSKNLFFSNISINSINLGFVKSIELLGPFGNNNSTPLFLIQNIKFIKPAIIKNKFINCLINKNKKNIKSVSFNHLKSKISYEILNNKNYFDVIVKIKNNIRNSNSSIQLEIIDLIKNTNKT